MLLSYQLPGIDLLLFLSARSLGQFLGFHSIAGERELLISSDLTGSQELANASYNLYVGFIPEDNTWSSRG